MTVQKDSNSVKCVNEKLHTNILVQDQGRWIINLWGDFMRL